MIKEFKYNLTYCNIMNISSLFTNLNDYTSSNNDDNNKKFVEDIKAFPIRDSTTLNQLLYKNEKYNRRELPRNDDKKPLYEIVTSKNIGLNELNSMIEKDIEDLKSKTWSQIPITVKKNLINEYCKKNDLEITESKIKDILKDKTLIKYSRVNKCIENITL
tara:strand:- start:1111 stop:1593 length:483 start_codon:yes stop_codon:yes gene_type:complete